MSFARELRIVVALPSSHLSSISAPLSLPTSRNGWLPRYGLSRGARSRGTTGTKAGHLTLASVQGQDPWHTGPRLVTSFWPLPRARSRAHGAKVGYLVLASAQRPDLGAQGNTVSFWPIPRGQIQGHNGTSVAISRFTFGLIPYVFSRDKLRGR
jgi:hypothetical protein